MDYRMINGNQGNWPKAFRSCQSYLEHANFCLEQLIELSERHSNIINQGNGRDKAHAARLIRDSIDDCLRRYHRYAINENKIFECASVRRKKRGYYYEVLDSKEWEFEHLIPMRVLRDRFLDGKVSAQHAMQPPIVILSKESEKNIVKKSHPHPYYPFRRYLDHNRKKLIKGTIITCTGKEIPDCGLYGYSLDDHYNLVAEMLSNSDEEHKKFYHDIIEPPTLSVEHSPISAVLLSLNRPTLVSSRAAREVVE